MASQRKPEVNPQRRGDLGCNNSCSGPLTWTECGASTCSRNTLKVTSENYRVSQRQRKGESWGVFWPRLLDSCSKLKLAFIPVSIISRSFIWPFLARVAWQKIELPSIVENSSVSISLFPENSDICQPNPGGSFMSRKCASEWVRPCVHNFIIKEVSCSMRNYRSRLCLF